MIIALIPARSGSKSIKDKSIIPLNGKPLFAYSIQTALACKKIDKVIVSTDSPKYARLAEKYGAQVPFLRPKKLATDASPVVKAIKHSISWLEKKGNIIDIILLLQPTSPFRKVKDIDKSLGIIKKPNTDSVVGVCEAEHNPYHVMAGIKNNYLDYPLFKTKKPIHYRQASPRVYRINGSLYTFKKNVFMKENTIFTKKTRPLIMPPELSIDIDTKTDLLYAEFMLKHSKLLVGMKTSTAKR